MSPSNAPAPPPRPAGKARVRKKPASASQVVDLTQAVDAGWFLESPLPKGLAHGFLDRGISSDLLVAGFPGYAAQRLFHLAWLCKLRDLARFCDGNGWLSGTGDLSTLLREQGIPLDEQNGCSGTEGVDIVVISAGYNDLYRGVSAGEICKILLQLEQVFAARNIPAVLLTIGKGHPGLEDERQLANTMLLAKGSKVVDCDAILDTLGPSVWKNHDHLNAMGYEKLGYLLATSVIDLVRPQESKGE